MPKDKIDLDGIDSLISYSRGYEAGVKAGAVEAAKEITDVLKNMGIRDAAEYLRMLEERPHAINDKKDLT